MKLHHIGKDRVHDICYDLIKHPDKNPNIIRSASRHILHQCHDCEKLIRLINIRCKDCELKYLKVNGGYKRLLKVGQNTQFKKGQKPLSTIKQKPPEKSINHKIVEQIKTEESTKLITPIVKLQSKYRPNGQYPENNGRWKNLPIVICEKSPTKRHHWILDFKNLGKCKYCREEKQF
jgi:hypothetical protein